MMRRNGAPFCPVCARRIFDLMATYTAQRDRFELNGNVTEIPGLTEFSVTDLDPFEEHTHFDPRVLEDFSRVRSSSESWSSWFSDLTLHNGSDNDWFNQPLPDPTASAPDGAHPGLPFECGELVRLGPFGAFDETVLVTGGATIAVSGVGLEQEEIAIQDNELSGIGGALRKTVSCPRSRGRDALRFSVGYRPPAFPGGVTPRRQCTRCPCLDYAMQVEYGVEVLRIPPRWLRDLIQVRELVAALQCSGGFFPRCVPPLPFEEIVVPHPLLPDPDCRADGPGCPMYIPFWWEGMAPFELSFTSDIDRSYRLLDERESLIAEALPLSFQAFGAPEALTSSVPFQSSVQTPEKRLFVPELGAGFYVLLVEGPAGDYLLRFVPPPRAADSDGDGVVDPFDPCPGSPEDIDGFRDADGCPDPRISIKPFEEPNPINRKSRGVVPVAILAGTSIDLTKVDVRSLRFGSCAAPGAAPAHDLARSSVLRAHLDDVNGDALRDLVAHFRQRETGLTRADVEACLEGQTADGPFVASDRVIVR
jgi:hypothetical protein